MLPLLPLTHNGANYEVVEETVDNIESLVEDENIKRDLVSLTLSLASLAFLGKKEEQNWLIRRFKMQHDIVYISIAQDEADAREYLLDVDKPDAQD